MVKKRAKKHQSYVDGKPVTQRRTDHVDLGMGKYDIYGNKTIDKYKHGKHIGNVNSPKVDDKPKGISNIQAMYLVGGVLDASAELMGSMSKASAIRMQGKYEEAGFIENGRRLRSAAERARKTGKKEAGRYMETIRKLEGSQKAAQAAQGIEISDGSALDAREETVELGLEDASTIRTNAYMQAFGFEQQALEQEHSAVMNRISRKAKEKSTLLSGRVRTVQSIANTGMSMNKAGSA